MKTYQEFLFVAEQISHVEPSRYTDMFNAAKERSMKNRIIRFRNKPGKSESRAHREREQEHQVYLHHDPVA
jgi:hypothetical protein